TLRSPYDIVTASNSPSANGRFIASASTKLRPRTSPKRFLPCASMPGEKSAATTCAPLAASDADDRHVPAARSRIFSPGLGFTARVVARRHTASSPNVMAIFVKSYRFATRSNMPLTVFGSLARSARCEVTRRVYAGLLAFFWSRFGALRRWGAADPALAVGCVSRKADEEGAPACADEDNAADRTLAFG